MNGVKVADSFRRFSFDSVLLRIDIQPQCMLSIGQWSYTYAPRADVPVGRLLTYNLFSEVRAPVDFLTVFAFYSIIVILPPLLLVK